jgi:3-phenylpropionate/trans-cinnamate dioxygenase ferredoxin reductase subunit
VSQRLVVIGAGHAAGQLLSSLAQDGFPGSIAVIGDEPHPPYQRPPLSKKFLAGELALDRLYVKPAAFYEKIGARLILAARATGIDRQQHFVTLDSGEPLPYTTLVIATGSRPRLLSLPGAGPCDVLYLRTIADVEAIRARFAPGRRLVIVGGGYIGLELAAVAARSGLQTTVLEQAPRLMARGVGPLVSAFYERLHREEGVAIVTGVAVSGIDGKGDGRHVIAGATRYPADIVVVGVGAVPNVELAAEAGLPVDNGIVVDAQCRTQDPAVFAIGDCTSQHHPMLGQRLRLESVNNAVEQAKVAAAAICARPMPPVQTPWFWSDQYDVKLQMAGLPAGHDSVVVRGNPETGRSFAVFYLRAGRLIAIDAVNRAPEFMMSRQLIAGGKALDAERLRDERIAVKDLAG